MTGEQDQVKAALRLLGAQMRRHPPRAPVPGSAGPLLLGHASHPDLSLYHGVYGAPGSGMGGPAGPPPPPMYGQPVEVTFRLLVPVGKAGNIIGRSGEHIKRIRMETGARIKVGLGAGALEGERWQETRGGRWAAWGRLGVQHEGEERVVQCGSWGVLHCYVGKGKALFALLGVGLHFYVLPFVFEKMEQVLLPGSMQAAAGGSPSFFLSSAHRLIASFPCRCTTPPARVRSGW